MYAKNKNGFELALKTWSKHVTLYTDKRHYLKPQEIDVQKKKNIRVVSEKITSVEGATGKVSNIVFANNKKERCDALFL